MDGDGRRKEREWAGEALLLKWIDLDMVNRTIRVNDPEKGKRQNIQNIQSIDGED